MQHVADAVGNRGVGQRRARFDQIKQRKLMCKTAFQLLDPRRAGRGGRHVGVGFQLVQQLPRPLERTKAFIGSIGPAQRGRTAVRAQEFLDQQRFRLFEANIGERAADPHEFFRALPFGKTGLAIDHLDERGDAVGFEPGGKVGRIDQQVGQVVLGTFLAQLCQCRPGLDRLQRRADDGGGLPPVASGQRPLACLIGPCVCRLRIGVDLRDGPGEIGAVAGAEEQGCHAVLRLGPEGRKIGHDYGHAQRHGLDQLDRRYQFAHPVRAARQADHRAGRDLLARGLVSQLAQKFDGAVEPQVAGPGLERLARRAVADQAQRNIGAARAQLRHGIQQQIEAFIGHHRACIADREAGRALRGDCPKTCAVDPVREDGNLFLGDAPFLAQEFCQRLRDGIDLVRLERDKALELEPEPVALALLEALDVRGPAHFPQPADLEMEGNPKRSRGDKRRQRVHMIGGRMDGGHLFFPCQSRNRCGSPLDIDIEREILRRLAKVVVSDPVEGGRRGARRLQAVVAVPGIPRPGGHGQVHARRLERADQSARPQRVSADVVGQDAGRHVKQGIGLRDIARADRVGQHRPQLEQVCQSLDLRRARLFRSAEHDLARQVPQHPRRLDQLSRIVQPERQPLGPPRMRIGLTGNARGPSGSRRIHAAQLARERGIGIRARRTLQSKPLDHRTGGSKAVTLEPGQQVGIILAAQRPQALPALHLPPQGVLAVQGEQLPGKPAQGAERLEAAQKDRAKPEGVGLFERIDLPFIACQRALQGLIRHVGTALLAQGLRLCPCPLCALPAELGCKLSHRVGCWLQTRLIWQRSRLCARRIFALGLRHGFTRCGS